jgi:hypothetical protein
MRVIPQGCRQLINRPLWLPMPPGSDELVRATVVACWKVYSVPVHGGDLRQPVLHDHPNSLATSCPKSGAEIASVVSAVGVAPGCRRYPSEKFGRSGGLGLCWYSEPAGEVESAGGADRSCAGPIVIAAHQFFATYAPIRVGPRSADFGRGRVARDAASCAKPLA